MSPSLSREHFFLSIINRFEEHHVIAGSLEWTLQVIILDIAHTVQNRLALDEKMIDRINRVFSEYQSIQLRVRLVPHKVHALSDGEGSEEEGESRKPILLHMEFIDEPDKLKRVYMEALISLLEALEMGNLELQRCMQCNHWYLPYHRAQITKFCSTKCRNRHHYVMNKLKAQ